YRRLEDVSQQLEWLGLQHRVSSRMMLERLAADADPAPLMTFDQVLEPINCDIRRQVRHYTYLTPLNRLVDATPPESTAAREFAGLVADWKKNEAAIRSQLVSWRHSSTLVMPLFQNSALLQEAVPLAHQTAA